MRIKKYMKIDSIVKNMQSNNTPLIDIKFDKKAWIENPISGIELAANGIKCKG